MTAVDTQTIHRVMHEIKRRKLEVLRVVDLTPRMRRITLGGPELAGFTSLGTDDHVKLLFPQNAEQTAALETMVLGAGKDNGPLPEMRDYTRAAMTWTNSSWTSTSSCTATALPRPGLNRPDPGNSCTSAGHAVR